jgi:hypothetical protein
MMINPAVIIKPEANLGFTHVYSNTLSRDRRIQNSGQGDYDRSEYEGCANHM